MFEALSNIPGLVVQQLPGGIVQVNVPSVGKTFKVYNEVVFESLAAGDKIVAIVDDTETPPLLRMFRSADDDETFVAGCDLWINAAKMVGFDSIVPRPMFVKAVGNDLIVGKHYNSNTHYELKRYTDGTFIIRYL